MSSMPCSTAAGFRQLSGICAAAGALLNARVASLVLGAHADRSFCSIDILPVCVQQACTRGSLAQLQHGSFCLQIMQGKVTWIYYSLTTSGLPKYLVMT